MKNLILIFGLIFGLSNYSSAQSASVNSVEYKLFKNKTKHHKQIRHFSRMKKDKKKKYNGAGYKRQTPYCVDLDGFAFNRRYDRRRRPVGQ